MITSGIAPTFEFRPDATQKTYPLTSRRFTPGKVSRRQRGEEMARHP